MRKFLFGAVALVLSAGIAHADLLLFSTPGWYQVAYSTFGLFFEAGPFSDEASCKSTLPAEDEDVMYACEYFDKKPDWNLK